MYCSIHTHSGENVEINPRAYDPGNYTLTVMATISNETTANTTIDFEGLGPESEKTIVAFIIY